MYLNIRSQIDGFLPDPHFTSVLIVLLNLMVYHQRGVFSLPAKENQFVVAQPPSGGTIVSDDPKQWLAAKIDAVADSLQKCVQYPGMSVAAVQLGKGDEDPMVLTRHYGVMDVDSQRPVHEDTKYCVGSLTKTFTAALLVQLLKENGSYTLDTTVKSILGSDFQLIASELTEQTTIRDILAHRVGIAQYFGAHVLGYNFTRQELIRRIRYIPILKQFRASFVPNNFLYTVAGQLCEKLNSSSWEIQLVNKILKPLNMDQTRFADKVADWNANFALPHALENGQLKVLRAKVTGNILRPLGASATICTTAGDMAKWLLMHLQNGSIQNGQQVLQVATDQLFDIHNHFPKPIRVSKGPSGIDHLATGAGLSWLPGTYRGTRIIYLDGMINYYFSLITLLPDKGIAVFSAMNGPHMFKSDSGLRALHYYIMDSLMGEKPWLDTSSICSFIATAPPFAVEHGKSSSPISSTTSSYTTSNAKVSENSPENSFDSKSGIVLLPATEDERLGSVGSTTHSGQTTTSSSLALTSPRRTIKLKKRRRKTTTHHVTKTVTTASSTNTKNQECDDNNCLTSATPGLLHAASSTVSSLPSGTSDLITTFSWLRSTEPLSISVEHNQTTSTRETPIYSSTSKVFGVRLRAGSRPLRRRRPRRHAQLLEHFRKYTGTYTNHFFGEIIININRTVPALQLNYGYYGRALLEPRPQNHVFQTHYFNSIWYQSESDDMKLYAKLGTLDVQFGNIDKESLPKKLVIFQFDPNKPPIFTRIN